MLGFDKKIGKDPDSMNNKIQPKWLQILLFKYLETIEGNDSKKLIFNDNDLLVVKSIENIEDDKDISLILSNKTAVSKPPISSSSSSLVTIGKFSAFLSCCACGLISCRSEEKEAFILVSY